MGNLGCEPKLDATSSGLHTVPSCREEHESDSFTELPFRESSHVYEVWFRWHVARAHHRYFHLSFCRSVTRTLHGLQTVAAHLSVAATRVFFSNYGEAYCWLVYRADFT